MGHEEKARKESKKELARAAVRRESEGWVLKKLGGALRKERVSSCPVECLLDLSVRVIGDLGINSFGGVEVLGKQ